MSRLEQTPQVVDWLSSRLGPYPFSSTGGLVTSLDPGFALENQTRPTYSLNGILTPSTLVHELAHQWFGDSVSVSRWRDVWLNEGAATFTEAWWTAAHGGEGAQQWMAHSYDLTPADSSFWRLEVADPGPDRMFDWRVYERGGMSLQALRHRIGRAEFRTLVHRWLSERREGNGSTEDFEALAEEVSGADLDGFFDAWLHTAAKPARTADNGFGG